MSPAAPLAVELLLSDHQRRPVTVGAHEAFRESIAPHPVVDHIDELAAEPALDRLPSRRSESAISRVLSILDSLPPVNKGEG